MSLQKSHEIRKRFLEYFHSKGHAILPSSPVIPHGDPTLLFTNAGMNQFKDVFLGKSSPDYKSATTSQKCIRAGGKHNDLENVGHTLRHLTFFEMLGNFSFGSYFKEEAIQYAWEVSTEIFGFDKEKIYPSVFAEDDEAFRIWEKYVPAARISRMGEKDNFWAMGDTGPCGPCSELYYDKGAEFANATSPLDDTTGDRFLEFWNLVFMQYNRRQDGVQEALAKPAIDTGAGLERVMSLILKKESVFETDILRTIISSIEEQSKKRYDLHASTAPAFRVIADHLRCLAFAIADGAQPSNIERGYVLRKILRRAVRYGKMIGFEEPFLAHLLPSVIATMGSDYKELITAQTRIADIVTLEEEAFFRTLRRGGNMLHQIIETASTHKKMISGEDAFKLKDTYGLPLEEIQLIAKDANLTVDIPAFQKLEKEAKDRSKTAHQAVKQVVEESLYHSFSQANEACLFMRKDEVHEATVTGLIKEGTLCSHASEGDEVMLIMDATTFYAEMGGQIGDTGIIKGPSGVLTVTNTISPYKGIICHVGKVESGVIHQGEKVIGEVDRARRALIANNHTATHLAHWALHQVLGEHVRQAGSIVDNEHLRFDFSHHKAVTQEEIKQIERAVNQKIRENKTVQAYELPYQEAQKRSDIKQFFGEKYGTTVRVIDIDFSKELCGGTHTSHTGNIGYFRIIKEGSIAAGVRRIEAVTGAQAEDFAYSHEEEMAQIATALKTSPHKAKERIEKLNEELKTAQNEVKSIKHEQIKNMMKAMMPLQKSAQGTFFVAHKVALQPDELKILADMILAHYPSSIIALACAAHDKAHFFIKVSQDLVATGQSANALIKVALHVAGGNGGGKAEMAQGAGKDIHKIDEALQELSTKIL